jgi:hypothetical protein
MIEFCIGLCYRFSVGLQCIIVYAELYQAILHYAMLCNDIDGQECTVILWLGWQKRLWQSDMAPYDCSLIKSASSFQQVWSPLIITHLSLTRLKANKFKSHHLNSQSLQHNPYLCSVQVSPYLWASYWNKSDSFKIKAKYIAKLNVATCNSEVPVNGIEHFWVLTSQALDNFLTPWYRHTVWTGRVFQANLLLNWTHESRYYITSK